MPPSSGPPTADDWESRRDLITRSYRDEDRPLKEIMELVNASGFRASPKMYKSRIHKWGLDKKLKEREAPAIVHMHARRRGKATRMLLRGKSVDIKMAESHLKRKRMTVEDVLKTVVDPLPGLVYETPRMSPEPFAPMAHLQEAHSNSNFQLQTLIERRHMQHLDSPTLLKTAELLFADVRECILSSFGTGSWVSDGPDEYYRPKNTRVCKRGACYEIDTVNMVFYEAFSKIRPVETLDLVTRKIRRTWSVQEEQPSMILQYLVQVVALFLMKRLKATVLELLSQTHFFYTSSGTEEMRTLSALVRICTRIRVLVHNDVALDYLPTALRALIDSHLEILDQYHVQTVHVAITLARVMGTIYGPAGIANPLEALHSSLDKQHSPSSRRSAVLLIEIASLHIQCDQFGAAGIVVQRLIEHAETLGLPIRNSAGWSFSRGMLLGLVLRLRRFLID